MSKKIEENIIINSIENSIIRFYNNLCLTNNNILIQLEILKHTKYYSDIEVLGLIDKMMKPSVLNTLNKIKEYDKDIKNYLKLYKLKFKEYKKLMSMNCEVNRNINCRLFNNEIKPFLTSEEVKELKKDKRKLQKIRKDIRQTRDTVDSICFILKKTDKILNVLNLNSNFLLSEILIQTKAC